MEGLLSTGPTPSSLKVNRWWNRMRALRILLSHTFTFYQHHLLFKEFITLSQKTFILGLVIVTVFRLF